MFRFREAIDIGITKSREHWGPQWSPDFLFPSWTDSIPFSSPCSYHHALALIRSYSRCNWITPALLTSEEAKHLSTHSMKSTLLAAAGQLNLNLEQRAKQGHHKKSVQLYSRDDVWPSLFLQRDILVDISTGWRQWTSHQGVQNNPSRNHRSMHLPSLKQIFNYYRCYHPKLIRAGISCHRGQLRYHLLHFQIQTVKTRPVPLHQALPLG